MCTTQSATENGNVYCIVLWLILGTCGRLGPCLEGGAQGWGGLFEGGICLYIAFSTPWMAKECRITVLECWTLVR